MSVDFSDSEFKEIASDFVIETDELLATIDQGLVELEKSPDNPELLNKIFRAIHTIKGASSFLGFTQMVELTHKTEDVLNRMRNNELKTTPEINDAILQSIDFIKLLVADIKNNDIKPLDISGVLQKLSLILKEESGDALYNETEASYVKLGEVLVEEKVITKKQLETALDYQEKQDNDGKPLGEILVDKKIITEEQLAETLAKQQVKTQKSPVSAEQTIRVDISRLDNVMNLVGELVLGRNQLENIALKMEELYGDEKIVSQLADTVAHIDLITTDLQLAVMKTRMQPVKKVFNRFPRMVRDLARERGKEIDIKIIGEDTELDKSVIEEIGDPLVHLIRNSVDHGIEAPDIREKRRKPRIGTIVLTAAHEGSNIVIKIKDDGNGLDIEKIANKAVKKGIISEKEVSRLSEKEIISFIFLPGFSTADTITDVSGRGVGMDVVKTNISKLNGIIDINTEKGKGMVIEIRLPLTVAIIQALIVQIGLEIYAIPLTTVNEIVSISPNEIQTIGDKEVIRLRNSVLPLLRLSEEFNVSIKEENRDNKIYVVVVGYLEQRLGLVVEKLHGEEEVVIKSIGSYLSDMKGISGATITGEGKVVLILDIAAFFTAANKKNNNMEEK